MSNVSQFKSFLEHANINFQENFPLNTITFTKTGGTVDLFIQPKRTKEVSSVIKGLKLNNIPYMVIGNASNLIINDSHLEGAIVNLSDLNTISIHSNSIKAGAGVLLADISKTATSASLSGLEFACGIPGSVGGAVCMNAGAYGGEMKDVIYEVAAIDSEGTIKILKNNELDFDYRQSNIKKNNYTVVEVAFKLTKKDQMLISSKVKEYTVLRNSKQPLEYPSCGSVFKRPSGYFAGALIQQAELQGIRIGGVEVSKKHAGFMVNVDNGTASDYVALIDLVQNTVLSKSGIRLETEVKIINHL